MPDPDTAPPGTSPRAAAAASTTTTTTTSSSSPSDLHVLIIGAGLTGLLVAHGLNKAGISYDLFETEEAGSTRPREWTMGVHWGVPLMEDLIPAELTARLIAEACVDPTLDYVTPPTNGSRIYDGVTGQLLKEMTVPERLLRVSRRKLRRLLSEGLAIKYSHTLIGLEYSDDGSGVTAHFTNGTEYKGTVVLGADGPRSAVRDQLVGLEKAKATPMDGVVHMSAVFSYRDAEVSRFIRTAHPVWSMMIHPEVFTYICIQDVPDPARPEDWTYFLFLCWRGEKDLSLSNDERMAFAKAKAALIQEPFRTAVQKIPDDVVIPYSDITYWVTQPWDTHGGRVTLAGDAAHPMPPYRGQGLNHAIQDAHNFVQGMAKLKICPGVTRAEIVDEYSEDVVKRGAEETLLSTKNGYMMLAYDDFKESPYMKHGLSKTTK